MIVIWTQLRISTAQLQFPQNIVVKFFFFRYAYFNNPPSGSWVKVNALRAQSKNVTAFDYNLWLSTQFFTPDDTIGEDPMWEQFDNVIRR